MKRIFFIMFACIFLTSSVSALELNPFADKKIYEPTLTEDLSQFIKEDFNEQYGVIRLSKTLFWIETDKLAEYSLIENSEQCLINCEARGKAVLYSPGKLFDDLNFIDKKGMNLDINAKYLIKTIETYDIEVPDTYKEVCEDILSNTTKGLIEKKCNEVVDTYKNETSQKEIWKEYQGETLKAGDYEWKVIASKKPTQSIDFIPTARGKALNEWAWWNGDWNKKQAINLKTSTGSTSDYEASFNISYNANMQTDFDDIRFVSKNESTELPYWIEAKVDSQWALVWVKIIDTINTTNQTIAYMYYENSGASSKSNASATFIFGDDFSTNTTSLYTTKGGSEVLKWDNSGFVYLDVSTGGGHRYFNPNPNVTISDNQRVITRTRTNTIATQGRAYAGLTNATETKYALVRGVRGDTAPNNKLTFERIKGGAGDNLNATFDITANTWYSTQIVKNGDVFTYWDAYVGNNASYSNNLTIGGNTTFSITNPQLSLFTRKLVSVVSWDYLLVAKFHGGTFTSSFGTQQNVNEEASVVLNYPIANFNSSSETINFNATITPINMDLINVTFRAGTIEETSALSGNETIVYNWTKTFADGDYSWNVTACGEGESTAINCSTTASRNFTIDSTAPVLSGVALNTSTVYNVGDKVKLNFTATDTHLSTCWYEYNGANTTVAGCQSGVQNQTDITTVAGQTTIRVWANDSLGNTNHSELLSFAYDTVAPTILVTSGNGTINYGSLTQNHTINFTVTDTNLDKVWVNYNGTNTTIIGAVSGTANATSFPLVLNLYNATIYANDTIGNVQSQVVSWDYRVFENSRTYENSSFEMSSEIFILNITTSHDITINSAILIYNGDSYTSLINTSGYNKIIYNIIDIPIVYTDTNISFYWNITYTNLTGTYILSSSINNQTVNYMLLTFCNETYSMNSLNLTTKDEENYTLLNNTININLQYYPVFSSGLLYKTFLYQNLTEDTPNRYLCIYPNYSEIIVSGIISYKSTAYDTRTYYLTDYTINNISENINLYLALIDNSDIVTFTVSDDFERSVEDALIIIEKWDIGLDEYIVVNTISTNSEGTASSNLILYETYYRFKVYYDNVLYLTDGPAILSTTIKNFKIRFSEVQDYSQFNDIDYYLTYNYTTNQTTFIWNNNGVNVTEGCLVIINQSSRLKVYDNCFSTSIGEISIIVNTPGTYNAYGLVTMNDEGEVLSKILNSIMFSNHQDEKYRIMRTYGQAVSFLLIGTVAMIGVAAGNIVLSLGLMIVAAIFINWLGFLDLRTFLWSIVSIIIIILVVSIRRRR